jgi:putative FmdB family regulatory protein
VPQYTFECQTCDLRFTRTLKMENYTTQPCPNCADPAPRVLEGFAFQFDQAPGASPGNSGVHDHDYPTADKAVGRSADERWALIHERDKVKEEARRQGGTHALIRHTGQDYIDYEPMNPAGIDARRELAKGMISTIRELASRRRKGSGAQNAGG